MNIVRLTTRIFPDKAGPSVYAYNLSKKVSDNNFYMFNITSRPSGIKHSSAIINPFFKIHYLPITAPRWDVNPISQLIFLIKFGYYSFKKILKIHRKFRIDLIHCDNPAITGLIASIFKIFFKIPFIYTHHGLDSHFKLNFLIELKFIFKYSSFHIIVSRSMIPFFERNKVDIKKLIWIPVGIDFQKFFHSRTTEEKKRIISQLKLTNILEVNDFIIIYVGYMDLKQKVLGMIDFLNGFNIFFKNIEYSARKNLKLLYLGDGKYKTLLKNEVKKLKLQDNVFLLGISSEIEKFYAISDFGALTSYVEGFPITLLEATASKIPCICTDVGEVKEIVDENSIISCGNIEQISEKLSLFYKNKDLCKTISESSFNKIKKFDWENIAIQIKKLYKDVVIESLYLKK